MPRKKIIIYAFSLFVIFMIILAGFFTYFFIKRASIWLPERSVYYYNQYVDTGRPSYLIQSLITKPKKDNTLRVLLLLLDEGDYQLAEILNRLLKVNNFQILAADAALLNGDVPVASNYMKDIKDSSLLKEFDNFILANGGEKYESTIAPQTESGKLLRMIEINNFDLYVLRDSLGEDLINLDKNTGALNALLERAELLARGGHPQLALLLLNSRVNECSRDYYIVRTDIERLTGSGLELATIKRGLACRPDDFEFLERAILYSTEAADYSGAKFYRERLEYLRRLSLD